MNEVRKIFCPTIEEEISQYKKIVELHNEQIGECSTCCYYIKPCLPGFVEDRGGCMWSCDVFIDKVLHLDKRISCERYEENTKLIEEFKKRIEERLNKDGKFGV